MGKNVGVSWMAKLEAQVQFCKSIVYCQVEGCLAISSGPDINNFSEAAEKESLLRTAKVGVLRHLLLGSHGENLN